jgi:riboflavin synthase
MFTGLVENIGTVLSVEKTGDGAVLVIETALASQLGPGDSIAVDGVCLTAREPGGGKFKADAMNETLQCTTLGALNPGDPVNLELAMAVGERLGGHIVQGHVDGAGTVDSVEQAGFSRVLRVELPDGLGRYVVEKGSIAIDGVSLTVSALGEDWLEVSLIPETLERTTLGRAQPGRRVNLEADVLAKHVERLIEHRNGEQERP